MVSCSERIVMPDTSSFISSIRITLAELDEKLTDDQLGSEGPESDADFSLNAKIWERVKDAEQSLAEVLEIVDNS